MFNQQQAEASFGSDDAFGICFEDATTGERFTLAEGNALYKANPGTCPDLLSVFPDDATSATVCTNYAIHIARALPGRVRLFGYYEEDNPTARTAQAVGGHDFAVVDDRFIVDPWIRLVESMSDRIFFDLDDPTDAAIIADLYGDRARWIEAEAETLTP